MKGASYVPIWGISLDFVPHVAGNRLAWHRTDKSARMDLVYDPVDFDERWQERSRCKLQLFDKGSQVP